MSTFFQGQKVRHVGIQNAPYKDAVANAMIGATGVLSHRLKQLGWWFVVIDSGLYDLEAHESALVPILPPGDPKIPAQFSLPDLLDRCRKGEGVPA